MPISLPDVVVSRNGRYSMLVTEVDQRASHVPNMAAVGVSTIVKLTPGGEPCWARIRFGRFEAATDSAPNRVGPRLELDKGVDQLVLFSLGEHLDEHGSPGSCIDQGFTIDVPDAMDSVIKASRREPASHSEVYRYVAAKLYWASLFDVSPVEFTYADSRRLGVKLETIIRVADAGHGELWNRVDNPLRPVYRPTARLWRDFEAGRIPGLVLPPVFQIQRLLSAPEYAPARHQFEKAVDLLQRGDRENAAKEAVGALESVALQVTGKRTGQLGELVKELRGKGEIPPPLDKVFEAIWGYTSQQSGVRHGGSTIPDLDERMAVFVVDLVAAAICFLVGANMHALPTNMA